MSYGPSLSEPTEPVTCATGRPLHTPCPVAFCPRLGCVPPPVCTHVLALRFTTNTGRSLLRKRILWTPPSPRASPCCSAWGPACPQASCGATTVCHYLGKMAWSRSLSLPSGCYDCTRLLGLALVQPSIKNFPFCVKKKKGLESYPGTTANPTGRGSRRRASPGPDPDPDPDPGPSQQPLVVLCSGRGEGLGCSPESRTRRGLHLEPHPL